MLRLMDEEMCANYQISSQSTPYLCLKTTCFMKKDKILYKRVTV